MNDYPCANALPDSDCPETPGYPARECTSFAAWRMTQVGHYPASWGNAASWPASAVTAGFTVDSIPAKGALYALGPNINGASPLGHVAFVVQVAGFSVLVEDYDWVRFAYYQHWMPSRGAKFIHIEVTDMTPEQAQQLADIHAALPALQAVHDALFLPVELGVDPPTTYPAYSEPNNLDIVRRTVKPYNEGYPPPDSAPVTVAAPVVADAPLGIESEPTP